MLRLARVLFEPRAVFAEVARQPPWFTPWLVITAVIVAAGLVTLPYTDRIMALDAAAHGITSVPESAVLISRVNALAVAPLAVLLFALVSAVIMWLVLRLPSDPFRFRGLLCAAMFAQSTTALQSILQAVVLRLRGAPEQAIRNAQDVRVTLGADLLLPAHAVVSPFVRSVLSGIGPLQLWGVIITAIGLQVLEKQGRGLAWSAALVSWIALLLLGGVLAGVGA